MTSGRTRSPASPAAPERSCVGCGARADQGELVRLVLVVLPDGTSSVVPDAKGGAFGRGAHVHATRECLDKACKKGLSRTFKRDVRADRDALAATIASAFARRIEGLLSGGVRGGHVAIGTDAVADAVSTGKAELVILAADATAAAQRSAVQKMTGAGKSLVFGEKKQLARALGRVVSEERDGVAVCAISNLALATAVRRAWLSAAGLSSTASAVSSDDSGVGLAPPVGGAHVSTGPSGRDGSVAEPPHGGARRPSEAE